jgi:dienelactone hydrolase
MRTRGFPVHLVLTISLAALLLGGLAASTWAQTIPGQRVTFTTSDGVELVATYYAATAAEGEKPPFVILLPAFRQDRSTYEPLVPALHEAGMAVLALDPRGQGESVGPKDMDLPARVEQRDKAVFAAMYRDVAAAYDWLAEQGQVDLTRFGVIGASMGCSVALDYAARDRSVDAIVCLTPGVDYLGLDSVVDIHKVGERPILLLASEDEREAADKLGQVNDAATVHVFEQRAAEKGELHGTRMFGQVPGVEGLIVTFLADNLGEPATEPVAASMHPRARVYYPADASQLKRLKVENIRWFSSAAEAEARGLTPSATVRGTQEEEREEEPAEENP